jgi:putative membrane protein
LTTCAFSLGLLGVACGSDQKSSNTADNAAVGSTYGSTTTSTGDTLTSAPNGEPVNTPASAPSGSSLNDASGNTNAGNAVASPRSSSQPTATPQLSQNQIAMITDLANSGEIEQAKLAQNKAKSPSVKKFAAMMIKHHTEAKNDQAKLYKQLGLVPTQSQTATSLKDGADKTLGSLRGADGANFDTTYMDAQVEEHQKVLDTINNELLPAASDQDLVNGLNKMKDTVESHLKEAKSIQAELATKVK